MPFSINAFKQQGLVYGGARPANFNVTLTVPSGLGISTASVSKFTFVCKAAELPAAPLASINVGYMGRKIKVAGDRTFPDWNVTVLNDEDFSVRSMFEMWSNGINRLEANVRDSALGEEAYKTDFIINQYAKTGELIRQYTMYGAWPIAPGAIGLDWDSTNAIETYPVSFAYDYWLPTVETSSLNAGGINTYNAQAQEDGPEGPN